MDGTCLPDFFSSQCIFFGLVLHKIMTHPCCQRGTLGLTLKIRVAEISQVVRLLPNTEVPLLQIAAKAGGVINLMPMGN